jgi:hypothetical protein
MSKHATLQFYRGNFATTVDVEIDCWADSATQSKIMEFLQKNQLHVRLLPPEPPPINSADDLIKALIDYSAELDLKEGQLTLGMAIDLIKQAVSHGTDKTTLDVHFDSYRGYYDDLGLLFHESTPRPIAKLLEDFEKQIGVIHFGWKGGEYQMYTSTRCWIAPPGVSTGIPLTAISLMNAINGVNR